MSRELTVVSCGAGSTVKMSFRNAGSEIGISYYHCHRRIAKAMNWIFQKARGRNWNFVRHGKEAPCRRRSCRKMTNTAATESRRRERRRRDRSLDSWNNNVEEEAELVVQIPAGEPAVTTAEGDLGRARLSWDAPVAPKARETCALRGWRNC